MKGGGELECKNVLDSYIGCGGGKKAAPGPAAQHACASWICSVAACGGTLWLSSLWAYLFMKEDKQCKPGPDRCSTVPPRGRSRPNSKREPC